MAPAPFQAGLRGKCPRCGEGALFESYLKFAPRCAACGADFTIADAGDGPAVFVILIVGALVTPLLFILQFGVGAPGWLAVGITLAAAAILCVLALPPFKGVLFALQWRHKASEARNEDVDL